MNLLRNKGNSCGFTHFARQSGIHIFRNYKNYKLRCYPSIEHIMTRTNVGTKTKHVLTRGPFHSLNIIEHPASLIQSTPKTNFTNGRSYSVQLQRHLYVPCSFGVTKHGMRSEKTISRQRACTKRHETALSLSISLTVSFGRFRKTP
jgi:hypothetical protein